VIIWRTKKWVDSMKVVWMQGNEVLCKTVGVGITVVEPSGSVGTTRLLDKYHRVVKLPTWNPQFQHQTIRNTISPTATRRRLSRGHKLTSTVCFMSPDSSLGIVTVYGMNDRMIGVRFPAGAEKFSLRHRVQTGSGPYPASYPMGTAELFPWGKAAGVWSRPLTSI
jgi:hypothetical protein